MNSRDKLLIMLYEANGDVSLSDIMTAGISSDDIDKAIEDKVVEIDIRRGAKLHITKKGRGEAKKYFLL